MLAGLNGQPQRRERHLRYGNYTPYWQSIDATNTQEMCRQKSDWLLVCNFERMMLNIHMMEVEKNKSFIAPPLKGPQHEVTYQSSKL